MDASNCPIVAIGASAGGLEALKALFASMPADSGAAFVVIQHLDPHADSLTAEILARCTAIPVVQAGEGMAAEANRVYVIPPNAYLTMSGPSFHLSEPVLLHGLRMPIDRFLWSLAEERHEQAVAIIVSGTGSDGTLGLRAIKGNGGLVMAQAPATAQYDGMPRSAIATGLVDVVSAVDAMPELLVRYLQHPYVRHGGRIAAAGTAAVADADELHQVVALLRARTGHDFRAYKPGTLERRVARRMGLQHVESLAQYRDFLDQHPDEVMKLLGDLLIGVTAFFRDGEAFEALDAEVLARIVDAKAAGDPVRVWVAGCASGEEAYSIAMLLMERLEAARKRCPLQVFATDIDEPALALARSGLYAENIVANLSPERLRRFFAHEQHGYRVIKALREAVTFSAQNLLSDPPFSKLDLLSCRNLLIYLKPEVQRKVLALFHFALLPGGYVFLGSSETVGQDEELFRPVSKKWRIYQRTGVAARVTADFAGGVGRKRAFGADGLAAARASDRAQLAELVRHEVLGEYAPAAVLVDRRHHSLYFLGPTARYLEQPTGTPTQDLPSLVRPELRAALRAALREAAGATAGGAVAEAHLSRDGMLVGVRLRVRSVHVPGAAESCWLVTFEDRPATAPVPVPGTLVSESELIRQLEHELKVAREELQSNIEAQDSATEELQAANEEVTSVNEELQSTNEELEASREELQSMNEELLTANEQLKGKVEELAASNDDLANLLASTDIATLFLDRELCIRRFTPATARVLNVIASDVGRPLRDIRPKFTGTELEDDARRVLAKLGAVESEVRTDAGAHFLRRVLPYRTGDERIAGVVVTFIDITARKQAERETQRLAAIVRDSNDAITIQDAAGRIVAWNAGAERMYGWSEREALGRSFADLVAPDERARERGEVARVMRGEPVASVETQRVTPDGRSLDVWLTMTRLVEQPGDAILVARTERDVSERNRMQAELRRSEAKFRAMVESGPDALLMHDATGRIVLANECATRLFGYSRDEMQNMSIEELMPERYRRQHVSQREGFSAAASTRAMGSGMDLIALSKDGREIPVEIGLSPVPSDGGIVGCAVVRDISQRKAAEKAVMAANELVKSAAATKSRFLATASHDLRQPLHSLVLLNRALLTINSSAEAEKMLAMQGEALQSMSRLLGSLLDITKLESGAIRARPADFPVQRLFEQLRAEFQAQADEKGLELRIVATDAVAHSDAGLLAQLLQNLVANAVRYTEKGQVVLRCRRAGQALRLEVEDSGIGIPADELQLIFEEFHQVNRDPQRRKEGLGLGLAIVQRIATLLDTRVEVRSEVGRGSMFSLAVPAGSGPAAALPYNAERRRRTRKPAGTVLLVDDDPAVLEASRMLLRIEGFNVVTAASPAEAYAALGDPATTPDVIVTDFHLGGPENGVDLVRAARQRCGRTIPAILVTGDTSPRAAGTGIEKLQGLNKPIDVEELLASIRKLLKGA